MAIEIITSLQNPRIKGLVRLQEKAAERKAQGLVVIEGHKEIGLAVRGGLKLREVYRCSALGAPQPATNAPVLEVSRDVFAKIAYRDDSDGLVAVAEVTHRGLDALESDKLILVLAAVEKPGNLGAIVRTADAVGAQVLVCDPRCDPWNPNAVRASVGTIFVVPVVTCDGAAARAWLATRGVRVVAAVLGGAPLWDADLKGPLAIVLGTEHEGLDPAWREVADVKVEIPMRGVNDSLNVSAAAAVLAYEAARQRR